MATADDTGFYELFIPTDLLNDYILYAQNPEASLGGVASNEGSEVRFIGARLAITSNNSLVSLEALESRTLFGQN